MPKTGGTSVHGAFNLQEGHPTRAYGGHDPCFLHPGELSARRVIGTVRDPWTWYRSLFEHVMNNNEGQRAQLAQWGGGSLEFRDVLYGWTGHREGYRPRPGIIWDPVDKSGPAPGEGLWSWAVRYFYQGAPGSWLTDCLLDTGQLDDALRLLGVEPVPPRNTRKQRGKGRFVAMAKAEAERALWDDEMFGWVQAGDATTAKLLGYLEPFTARQGGPLFDCAPAESVAA